LYALRPAVRVHGADHGRCPVSHGRQGTDGNLMARIRIGDAPAAEAPAQPPAAEVKTGRQRIAEARRKKALPGKR